MIAANLKVSASRVYSQSQSGFISILGHDAQVPLRGADCAASNLIFIARSPDTIISDSTLDNCTIIVEDSVQKLEFARCNLLNISIFTGQFEGLSFDRVRNLRSDQELNFLLRERDASLDVVFLNTKVSFRFENNAGSSIKFSQSEVVRYSSMWNENKIIGLRSNFTDCCFSGKVASLEISNCEFYRGSWSIETFKTANSTMDWVEFSETKIDIDSILENFKDKSTIFVAGANISDPWSHLRDEYTGARLYIVLVMTIAFFLPYAIKAFFLLYVNQISESDLEIERVYLFEVLLFGSYSGLWKCAYAALGIVLVVYNCARLIITLKVSKMREREEHLVLYGFSFAKPRPSKIKVIWWIHFFLSILFWVSLFAAAARVLEALSTMVPNPL